MRRLAPFLSGVFGLFPFACCAQQVPATIPDAPTPTVNRQVNHEYSPPTQRERFKTYVRHTYSLSSLVEAGVNAGIAQARDNPSQWPEGAEGYGDRFGSAFGEIVARDTTEYLVADIFREDLRRAHCPQPCSESVFKLAFEDSFLARKGSDGHEAFSVARVVGPFSGSAVATNAWYPPGSGRSNIPRDAGFQFALIYIRNVIRESIAHR